MYNESVVSKPLSVSQLNSQVRHLLETHYGAINVQGEISNLAKPASGHVYFTLKDGNGQIRAAMFKSSASRNRYVPQAGDEVVVRGKISLYEPRGDYQLIATSIKPAGEGALQLAFLQLKEKLEKEGLFDPVHKKEIPESLARVGIVTSATGAAVHDILTVLKRRFPAMEVIIYPVAVQGQEAPAQIADAIIRANRHPLVDCLIVGRGGGSLEDLWSFNDERVARAIFHSQLPVISAVGHEVDVTISDYVADLRAATPSAAAELISPDQQEIIQTLDGYEQWLVHHMQTRMKQMSVQVDHLRSRLRHPGEKLADQRNLLTQLQHRLHQSQQKQLKHQRHNLEQLAIRIRSQSPQQHLNLHRQNVAGLKQRLNHHMQQTVDSKQQLIAALARELNAVSPLATLDRGYSITFNRNQQAIRQSDQVAKGDKLTTKLHDGELVSVVEEIR